MSIELWYFRNTCTVSFCFWVVSKLIQSEVHEVYESPAADGLISTQPECKNGSRHIGQISGFLLLICESYLHHVTLTGNSRNFVSCDSVVKQSVSALCITDVDLLLIFNLKAEVWYRLGQDAAEPSISQILAKYVQRTPRSNKETNSYINIPQNPMSIFLILVTSVQIEKLIHNKKAVATMECMLKEKITNQTTENGKYSEDMKFSDIIPKI